MNNKEKQFTEDIDRLIAGEHPESKEASPEDYEKNVQFAKKMLDSRVEPSPGFKENLRRRLLQKIVESEIETERKQVRARSFWDFAGNLIPRSSVWRTVTATIVVFVLVLIVVWRLGVFTESNQPPILGTPPPTNITQGPVQATATTSQSTYNIGQPINVEFTFKNTGSETLTLNPFPPQILIAAASLKPYKTIAGGESVTLIPGETAKCTITWDQTDNEGVQVPVGEYVINMLDIELNNGKIVSLADSPHITILP